MKKLLLCAFAALPFIVNGQKNIVKVNASSLVLNNYSLQYERKVAPKISVALGVRYMPKDGLPFQEEAEDLFNLDESEINVGRFAMGNIAITPEARIYLSTKKNMRGFYVAPYARYANFDMRVPVRYESNVVSVKRDADFDGKITSISGGVMFGTQYSFGRFVLDVWLVGGHYGTSNGDLDVTFGTPLTPFEQQSLRDQLAEFDPKPFKFTYTVNANNAQMTADGPWAGIRGLGFNLGFRF